MQRSPQNEQPSRAVSSDTLPYSGSSYSLSTTTASSESSLHSSATNFGLVSLISDCGEDFTGCELTPEEKHWLDMTHAFTKAEKPFREQKKTFRVVRKLRTWHPRRGVSWSFLRRLYNGRQDMKAEAGAELMDPSVE
ncbi:unnamed protein product [Caenorhabditis sp. 36 PRJEB53466]|nr:unnamed protein product [Caenorhabditis sp. 36 PRJEB53466]